jgi:excisionase family DNA binding protein
MNDTNTNYLDIRDVAEHFGVSVETVRRWWYSGTIPAPIRLGKRLVRWRTAEIERWEKYVKAIPRPPVKPTSPEVPA